MLRPSCLLCLLLKWELIELLPQICYFPFNDAKVSISEDEVRAHKLTLSGRTGPHQANYSLSFLLFRCLCSDNKWWLNRQGRWGEMDYKPGKWHKAMQWMLFAVMLWSHFFSLHLCKPVQQGFPKFGVSLFWSLTGAGVIAHCKALKFLAASHRDSPSHSFQAGIQRKVLLRQRCCSPVDISSLLELILMMSVEGDTLFLLAQKVTPRGSLQKEK